MALFRLISALIAGVTMVGALCGSAAEPTEKKPLFLPKSPVAAAYVLARLSNKELIEAPRGEFVYVALLQRAGLDRKYRIEAIEGLAKLRGTDAVAEMIRGISELDKKGEAVLAVVREIVILLLQKSPAELGVKRADLEKLVEDSQLPLARQAGYAALVTVDETIDKIWQSVESEPSKHADLLLSIPLIRSNTLRAGLYTRLRPLLDKSTEVRPAAMTAIVAVPGHDVETFNALAGMVVKGTERSTAIASLQSIPRKSWPKEQAEPLLASLMEYLKQLPPEQRTGPEGLGAFQLASDLVPLLPSEQTKAAAKALRGVGVSVFVIRTIHEQMIYDKSLLVVEAGKPVEIILINEDAMPHNLVVVAPGAAEEIGKAAEKMAPEPDSEGRLYVPASPKVLHATKLIDGGQQAKISFTAPADPGEYQYICSFPGHWMRMLGTLAVVKDVEDYLATRTAPVEPVMTEWTVEQLASELPKVSSGRNLANGRDLFTKTACAQCHKLGSEGYSFGPDLTDVFKRYQNDRSVVLRQIIEPSLVIADRYRNFLFDLTDGEILTGMIVKEDGDSVTVQSGPADALIQTLPKSKIKSRTLQSSSLMPLGLLNLMTKDQILDLLAYVEQGPTAHSHQH